jgi:hypothetical protein
VLLLSLTRVGDPDAWGHLTQGREIWEARGLPETEALTYPATERPYTYTSWLFGVVCYLVHLAAGGAGLVLLKAGLVTLAFGLLLADALVPHRNRAVAVAAASAAVLLSQYRFVLRPDLMAMVFLAFSILSLNAYVYERRRLVFFLPLVHWLWANSHSSIVLMLVPYLAHLVGGVLQIRFERGAGRSPSFPTAKQLGVVGLLLVLSLAATLANPNSTGQLFVGGEILAQPSYSSGILELQPPTPSQKMALVAVAACVLGSFALRWQPAAIVDLLVVLPFLVLPFFGSRFAFYAGFVGAPVLARNVSSFLRRRNRYRRCGARAAAAAFAGWLVVYGSLALARVEPFGGSKAGSSTRFDSVSTCSGPASPDERSSSRVAGRCPPTFSNDTPGSPARRRSWSSSGPSTGSNRCFSRTAPGCWVGARSGRRPGFRYRVEPGPSCTGTTCPGCSSDAEVGTNP